VVSSGGWRPSAILSTIEGRERSTNHAADVALADTFALADFDHRSRAAQHQIVKPAAARAVAFRILESIFAAEAQPAAIMRIARRRTHAGVSDASSIVVSGVRLRFAESRERQSERESNPVLVQLRSLDQ
jgi:CRISPR/Cas system-associated endoribonuclease Cas2